MNTSQIFLLCLCGAFFLIVALIAAIGDHYSLKGIPNKPVGNGQHGTARFATHGEVVKTYKHIPYTPKLWRSGEQLPTVDGLIVGCHETATGMTALVDDADIHTLMIGASGVGKTANFLYPNIEYCCAAGMSFVTTDSKGYLYRNTATIAEKYYGYKISVIDLRNPTRSSGYNMLYLEILTVADEKGGTLDKRVMFYMDEVGTLPKIDGLEMIFSASRSRKVSIVAIIQSLAQFEKTYGKEGAEIIVDNCQCTLFGAFAPNSKTAEAMSQNLGKQTVLSGTVTRSSGRDGGNRQLQMIERPLMTVDELKSMPKGHFIVMKTGCHPMKTRLKLFFKWGIVFEDAYSISEKSERKVQYADNKEVEAAVLEKFPPKSIPIEFMNGFEDVNEGTVSKKHPPKTRKGAT